MVQKAALWLYVDNGRKTGLFKVNSVKFPEELMVGVGKSSAREIERLWNSAGSEITVGVTDSPKNAPQFKRAFTAMGAKKAINSVMMRCGI